MSWLLLIITSYLIGSIPSGLILGKYFWNKDLRKYGSHNIGATNAWRIIGKKAGLLIFLCDFLKGQLGVFIGEWLIGSAGAMVLGGLFAIIGHIFPIFLNSRGGKGVATSLGVITVLMPKIVMILLIVWIVLVFVTRYVSFGSIVAAILAPILALIFLVPLIYFTFALVIAVVIVWSHRENIARLRAGRENKI